MTPTKGKEISKRKLKGRFVTWVFGTLDRTHVGAIF